MSSHRPSEARRFAVIAEIRFAPHCGKSSGSIQCEPYRKEAQFTLVNELPKGMRWKLAVVVIGFLMLASGIGWYLFLSKENATLKRTLKRSKVLETYENTFKTTVYYTPRESGFTESEGFDTELETRPGLAGKRYPRSFLNAVEIEGFGRIEQPVDGKHYIAHYGGTWKFAEEPVDAQGRPLKPKTSAAVDEGHGKLKPGAEFKVEYENVEGVIERETWKVMDTGGGLEDKQIDLYWGEADPKGPGRLITIPENAPTDIEDPTVKVLE